MSDSARAVTRRHLLQGAGAFLFAFHLPTDAGGSQRSARQDARSFEANAFISIDTSGRTTLMMPQVEMGQGVYTSVAMILAEELDADYSLIALEHAPPNEKLYANPALGIQATGSSTSIRAFWMPLRQAGATARAMIVSAAAKKWQVDPATCLTHQGQVIHPASGRSTSYGALVEAAALEPKPATVSLKEPSTFRLIGTPARRFDAQAKVNGSAIYGIDAQIPGMVYATIAQCPVLGGIVGYVDSAPARTVPGVTQVIVLSDMVAVVANSVWTAKKGLAALQIDWAEGKNANVSTEDLWHDLRAAATTREGAVAASRGDIASGLEGHTRIDATYELPFLAHATMEPPNCTLVVTEDRCEIWIGNQIIARLQQQVAAALGLPLSSVVVHNHLIGGGFGRRLEVDMALTAARIAQAMRGQVVKVVWTRDEDIQHDIYRPLYHDMMSARIANGTIAAWKHKISGSSVLARWLCRASINVRTATIRMRMPLQAWD